MKENLDLQVIEKKNEIMANLILNGDLSKMKPEQKVIYTLQVCEKLGLNPETQPFQLIVLKGKERLYATKDCTEQLRKIHKVSIIESDTKIENGIIVTRVKVQDGTGRFDVSTGAVPQAKAPEDLCNAIMKAETKAKRRATLSICGLGMLEESELDTMKDFETKPLTVIETVTAEEMQQKEDLSTNHPAEPPAEPPAKFQTQLRDVIRVKCGGKMSLKEAIVKLNELTGKSYKSFPLDEKECSILLTKILSASN